MLIKHFGITMEFNLKGSEKKKKKNSTEKLAEIQRSETFQLESSDKAAKLDTSQWPLLLKVSLFWYFFSFTLELGHLNSKNIRLGQTNSSTFYIEFRSYERPYQPLHPHSGRFEPP